VRASRNHPADTNRLGSEAGLRLFGDRGKTGSIVHGNVCQHATVDFDRCLLQTVDETAVGKTVQTRGGVDTGDPESAELTLLLTAVTVGVLTRLMTA